MRVYLDENLSPRVAQILRAHGIAAISAYEVGNVGLDDGAQLRYATAAGRAIVTGNVEDFVALDRAAIAANAAHAGILLISRTFRLNEFGALADAIVRVAKLYPAGMSHTVVYLSRASAPGA